MPSPSATYFCVCHLLFIFTYLCICFGTEVWTLWCDRLPMLMSDHMGISACLTSSNQSSACLNTAHQGLLLCKHQCSSIVSSVKDSIRQQGVKFIFPNSSCQFQLWSIFAYVIQSKLCVFGHSPPRFHGIFCRCAGVRWTLQRWQGHAVTGPCCWPSCSAGSLVRTPPVTSKPSCSPLSR